MSHPPPIQQHCTPSHLILRIFGCPLTGALTEQLCIAAHLAASLILTTPLALDGASGGGIAPHPPPTVPTPPHSSAHNLPPHTPFTPSSSAAGGGGGSSKSSSSDRNSSALELPVHLLPALQLVARGVCFLPNSSDVLSALLPRLEWLLQHPLAALHVAAIAGHMGQVYPQPQVGWMSESEAVWCVPSGVGACMLPGQLLPASCSGQRVHKDCGGGCC